jgi:MFS transporter, FHS family, Na+ dependent glucose transporter 1
MQVCSLPGTLFMHLSSPAARTVAYYLALGMLGLSMATLGPALPVLAGNTQSSLSQISFLFTARSLGKLAGAFQGGRLYDRLPGHRLMASMLVVMAAMAFLIPVIPELWWLIAVLLVLGAAEGALDVGGNTLLVWVHGSRVGPYMNGLHFVWGVGAFLSPILIAQALLYSGDISWAYWALGILMVPVAIHLWRLPDPGAISARLEREGQGHIQANRLLVGLVVCFFFLYVGMEATFGGWIYTYATTLVLADAATAAYLTSAFWGALTVGRLVAIPIAAYLRPSRILLVDLLGCLVSVGLILLWPDSTMVLWAGTLGAGLFMASIFPTALAFVGRRMRVTGTITGWFFAGASTGGMTFPWLVGQFFESMGPQVTMVLIGADVVLAMGIFGALMRSAGQPSIQLIEDAGVSGA